MHKEMAGLAVWDRGSQELEIIESNTMKQHYRFFIYLSHRKTKKIRNKRNGLDKTGQ